MSDQALDACPHCGAGVLIMDNGKQCRAASGAWVTFDCLTAIHAGEHPRMSQSRNCEEAEREKLAMEVAALRTANAGLVEKVAELQSWKDQQMQVESEWRPNDLAALLGGGLGEPQRVVIQREALKLVESIKDRERERDHANAVADALVRENAALMERVMLIQSAGQDAVDFIDGKHAMAGRVLDGWRKATQ